jgi:hypothetical protein
MKIFQPNGSTTRSIKLLVLLAVAAAWGEDVLRFSWAVTTHYEPSWTRSEVDNLVDLIDTAKRLPPQLDNASKLSELLYAPNLRFTSDHPPRVIISGHPSHVKIIAVDDKILTLQLKSSFSECHALVSYLLIARPDLSPTVVADGRAYHWTQFAEGNLTRALPECPDRGSSQAVLLIFPLGPPTTNSGNTFKNGRPE